MTTLSYLDVSLNHDFLPALAIINKYVYIRF